MHIISWNVNGIRAVLKKDAFSPLLALNPDIICLQETKTCPISNPNLDLHLYPHIFFHNGTKKGYSGTAIISKFKPISVTYDLPNSHNNHFLEGRVITAEFKEFFLVNIYVPNAKPDLARLKYRETTWDPDLRNHLIHLSKTKHVVAVGDFNVAHQEIDLENPAANRGHAGFTDEERHQFDILLHSGFIDTFRHLHPNATQQYSWWSYRTRARERNSGWRIDYVLCSESLTPKLSKALIHPNILGSDHAPVSATFNLG